MKKVLFLLCIFYCFQPMAQNVGIGTTTPAAKLQINHRSNTAPGLQLIDSAASGAGSVRFRNINNAVGIFMSGYSGSSYNRDQYLDITSDTAFISTFRGNGNVGIKNATPLYPLDVAGDINTNGVVRVNGNAGTSGQVLKSNGDGTMAWDEVGDYKNYVTFNFTTTGAVQNWVVPAGIAKIKVELWGGGGYGTHIFLVSQETSGAGGGGGGYVTGYFDVTAGASVSVVVGGGGTVGVNGGNSRVDVGPKALIANGGTNGVYNATGPRFELGIGGSFSAIGTTNYAGTPGQMGQPTITYFDQKSATDFVRRLEYGSGGNAGNTLYTGGKGGYDLSNMTTPATLVRTYGSAGAVPGGGGASNGPTGSGANGGNGLAIIYY